MTDELKQWEYDRGYEKGKADVLDKIRTEISYDIHRCNNTDMAFGMQHTLDIIDKYRKEQE